MATSCTCGSSVVIIRNLLFESDESGTILVLNNTNRVEAKRRLATVTFVEE